MNLYKMIFRKKYLLLIIFLLIMIQTLLYTNNNQKTSFRFLEWSYKEVSLGKLISISFFSGLFVSTLLNNSITSNKIKTFKNIEENYESQINEENYEELNNKEDMKSNIEMPPQRDIRDSQPTISVNYRVIKNREENNFKKDRNYSDPDNNDDWDNGNNDW